MRMILDTIIDTTKLFNKALEDASKKPDEDEQEKTERNKAEQDASSEQEPRIIGL